MSFEVVVRPAVFPNIRPSPAQPSLPGDAPDKGVATMAGSSGKLLTLPWSESVSMSDQKQEQKRTYEKVRVPYTNPDGTLDWTHYTEYEVATDISFLPGFKLKFNPPKETESLQLMGRFTRTAGDGT